MTNAQSTNNRLLSEVRSMLYLTEDLEYITISEAKELRTKCCKLSGSIANLMKRARQKIDTQSDDYIPCDFHVANKKQIINT